MEQIEIDNLRFILVKFCLWIDMMIIMLRY